MYILKQTNILKYGLITIGLIIALFCFYVIVGFLGIQYLMEPYQYGTFFAWVIILFGVFYRFTFLLLTVGVFFGIINVLDWHLVFAILFTLPSLLFIFPKQILSFKMKTRTKQKPQNTSFNDYSNTSNQNQQNINRFKGKSQNNDIIDADYEVIKDSKDNK
ncbi:hypothetical protein OAO48_02560 [Alphaproteobacteria bacterium]|nr:hypothetical protein [Alphaproteobacteria bacterium]